MSSQPIKQKQLGLKESREPHDNPNKGFKGSDANPAAPSEYSDWKGKVKGKTKHTYKRSDAYGE